MNMQEKLENLYTNLKGNQIMYPESLANAAELYKMNYCKARKNGSNGCNNTTGDEEKEGDKSGQAAGVHFEVENSNKDEAEEHEDITVKVTELLGLYDDEFDLTDNDDI